ncbi:hypothetical protein [Rummeliibacillus sp. TYF-LIM-RU47]|uniref:hypothetical protein n=1 Tax=Rummeliibacillus sp. TYF-LIM-RU47 TaxID=2608406 RepID=UPI00123BCE37|nr:hypothetical protein [Rummeliibacillus sp. TYF-LIM-RU47]
MAEETLEQQQAQLKKIITASRKYKKIYDTNANVNKSKIAKAERDLLVLKGIANGNGLMAKLATKVHAALEAALTAAKEKNENKLAKVAELHSAAEAEAERLEREMRKE